MINNELLDYIRKELLASQSEESIRSNLINIGWQESDVNEAFLQVKSTILNVNEIVKPINTLVENKDVEQKINISNSNYVDIENTNVSSQTNVDDYPFFEIKLIENPNRFFAIPFLGVLIKFILAIPSQFIIIFYSVYAYFANILNACHILITGKYMPKVFELNLGLMRYNLKYTCYLFGLSNFYPGFNLNINDPNISLNMNCPTKSNRLMGAPILRFLIRFILLFPLLFFVSFLQQVAFAAYLLSLLPIIFTGKFPLTFFDLISDFLKLSNKVACYIYSMSDKYPKFKLNMSRNKTNKVIVLILGAILFILNFVSSLSKDLNQDKNNFIYDKTEYRSTDFEN